MSQAYFTEPFRRVYLVSSLIFVFPYLLKLFVMLLEAFLACCVYLGGFFPLIVAHLGWDVSGLSSEAF
jgi:hypothetical protein